MKVEPSLKTPYIILPWQEFDEAFVFAGFYFVYNF